MVMFFYGIFFFFLGFAEISQQGEKYVDEQVENAVNGVKAMKDVMKKSSADREKLLHALEKTKEQKEVPRVALCLKTLFLCVIKRKKKTGDSCKPKPNKKSTNCI